jgi:hypothetical protein
LRRAALTLAAALSACAPAADEAAPRVPGPAGSDAHEVPAKAAPEFADGNWGAFHSQRFQLTVPLPEGKAWRIDDHREPELSARHEGTTSRITLSVFREDDLMNRNKCREAAKRRGLVSDEGLSLVADEVTVGPEAYDTRIWIALGGAPGAAPHGRGKREGDPPPAPASGKLVGHLFATGAFLRTCLFFHFVTEVADAKDEAVLSHRLAVARTRILGAIRLDPPRTTWDADAPKEKP